MHKGASKGAVFVWALIVLGAACQPADTTSPGEQKPPSLPPPLAGEVETVVRLNLPVGSSISPDALVVTAGMHQSRNTGALGAINHDTAVVQLVVAATTSGAPVMLGVIAGRATGDVVLDARSTAEALVLISPMIATSDPSSSRERAALVRASSKFESLVGTVGARLTTGPSTWLTQDDPAVTAAVESVVLEVLPRIAAATGQISSFGLVPGLVGLNDRNGIRASGSAGGNGYTVTIENSRSRWLAVVARLSVDNKTYGPPLNPLGSGASFPTLIASSKLLNLVFSKPTTTVSLGANFARARIKVFGLGLGKSGPPALDDPDKRYLYSASTATVVLDMFIPIVQMAIGIRDLSVTFPDDGTGWPRQLIRLTVDCLTGLNGSLEDADNPVVETVFRGMLTKPELRAFAEPTLKCAVRSALESEAVLLAILTSVGKAGALAAVVNNISYLKLVLLAWGAADLSKTFIDVARSDALTVFDIVDSESRIFAASIGGSLQSSSGPSDLYEVDVSSLGSDRLIGRLKTAAGALPAITDLALAPNRKLWAISFDRLYSVDTLTGALTDVGALGHIDVNALAADANGNLFGATLLSQSLIRISSTTGGSTIVGQFQGDFVSNGDIAFAPDGRLLAALRTSGGSSVLASLDPGNGKATPVRAGSVIGFDRVWGLKFVGNRLIGLTTDAIGQGTLIEINLTTGQGTAIRSLEFNAGGAALRSEKH